MLGSATDSRTINDVERKTKQRKEKKKKDQVVHHPGTQLEIVKGGREKSKTDDPEPEEKKKKRKRDREDEEPLSADKKRKRKSEKISGTTYSPTSIIPATDSPLEIAGAVAAASDPEIKEKRRRRKSKSPAEKSGPHTSVPGPTPTASSTDELVKSRKLKYTKGDAVDVSVEAGSAVQTEGHPSRQRRKSKRPIYPDPSDDPDLIEQSQKALTYIYSQFTSPEAWKFNKARQNWVVRNVWTSKVPEKYVPMVVEYLSKVQGQVRETLIESCKMVVSGSSQGPPGMRAETTASGSSENANPSAPRATVDERSKWAEALLCALASRS